MSAPIVYKDGIVKDTLFTILTNGSVTTADSNYIVDDYGDINFETQSTDSDNSISTDGTVYDSAFVITDDGNVIGEYPDYIVDDSGYVIFNRVDDPGINNTNGLIEIGYDGQAIDPVIVLSTRSGNKYGVIPNVKAIQRTHPLNDVAELSFDVYKEVDGEICPNWNDIKDFKFIQIPHDNTWYEAHITIDEDNNTVKHAQCIHANEAELSQLYLYEVEINTEDDIARDDYVETCFYNPDNPDGSLLDRILSDKAPYYQIYHVDDSLKNLYRVFSFDGTSIHDALNEISEEINCLFIYGEWSENDGCYHRTISAYDLEDVCLDCGKRGEFSNGVCTSCGSTNIKEGYGEDTGIFISVENLSDSISYETNVDDVKNCFRLTAGDDVMTAAIKSCNPNMSQYMWYFSDDMLEDMSEGLSDKLTEYENLVSYYKDEAQIDIAQSYIDTYNTLVETYGSESTELTTLEYPIIGTTQLIEAYYYATNLYGYLKSEMMPSSESVGDTSAVEQMDILSSNNNMSRVGISSVSGTIAYTTANSAIQSYAKVFIDTARYKVSVFTNDIEGTTWNGTITITSYTNEDDTDTSEFTITLFDGSDNETYSEWLEQSVKKAMANREATDLSVVKLFESSETVADFTQRIKQYSLDYLNIMYEMATSALTIMAEQGIASSTSTNTDVYTGLYKPYLDKSVALQNEIAQRELELSYLLLPTDDEGNTDTRYQDPGFLDVINNAQTSIRDTLDMRNFLTEEYWEELSFYRRETDFSNSNYISDGLTDSEIVEQAQQFYEVAEKEIVKAATLQHSISASLRDFLLMPEFFALQKHFKTGNWIHLEVDEKIYKLRMTNWTVDYDSIEDLDIEFSDVVLAGDTISDIESILSQSKSIATTYDYTQRKATKGDDASNVLKAYKNNGIDFNKIKAIKSRGNTNIVYDDDGILLQRVYDNDTLPEQARIYNNGIYITKDAWETVSTGLGHFSYVDPETDQTVETYGIIADTVIGKLILGDQLKIYSQSNRFQASDDGVVITAKEDADNTDLFVVQKDTGEVDEYGNPVYDKYIYVDSDGDVKISGSSVFIGTQTVSEAVDDAKKVATNYLSIDSSGIMVANMSNGIQTPSNATGRNVMITSNDVEIRNGQTNLATFGTEIVIGQTSSKNVLVNSSGVNIRNGSTSLGYFGDNVRIGRSGSGNMTITKSKVNVYGYNGGNALSFGTKNDESTGLATVTEVLEVGEWNNGENSTVRIGAYTNHKIVAVSSCLKNNSTSISVTVDGNYFVYNNTSLANGNYIVITYTTDDVVSFLQVGSAHSTGSNSLGVGSETQSSGVNAVAFGGSTSARGSNSFAAGYLTDSRGEASVAFGRETSASGEGSFATGVGTSAKGAYSATFGANTTASGDNSLSAGWGSSATGDYSAAFGLNTIASGLNTFACGQGNISSSNDLFCVGYGSSSQRSNAFRVNKYGNAFFAGLLYSGDGLNVPTKKLFAFNAFSETSESVAAGGVLRVGIDITKEDYTPVAIAGVQLLNSKFSYYCAYINATDDEIAVYIKNNGTSADTTKINVRIFYVTYVSMY